MTVSPVAPLSFEARLDAIRTHLKAVAFAQALESAHAALDAAAAPLERVAAGYWLARCHYMSGDTDLALAQANESRAAAAALGETVWEAMCTTLQARCLASAGESDAAHDAALRALKLVEPLGARDEAARAAQQGAVIALGVLYLQLGDLALAMAWVQRGIDEARLLLDPSAYAAAVDTQACVLSALAEQARSTGDDAEARRLELQAIVRGSEAVDVARRCGHLEYETSASLNLAESLTLTGEAARALELLLEWGRRHPQAPARHRMHWLDALGQVYLALGQPEDAVLALQDALGCTESPLPLRSVVAEHLSAALERCGRWREALEQYKLFHQLSTKASAERAQRSARVAAVRLEINRALARASELTVSNAELTRRADDLARQANEDALTGLPNRRQVDHLLADWPQPLALAMIDVDHFKQVNDRHSHAVGDQVLRQVAALLRGSCRPSDVAARFGGEEFVVLLDNRRDAAPAGLRGAAERLRVAVETYDWGTLVPGLSVTVSIGLATSSEVAGAGQLLAKADERLYAAKRAGRNRVVDFG